MGVNVWLIANHRLFIQRTLKLTPRTSVQWSSPPTRAFPPFSFPFMDSATTCLPSLPFDCQASPTTWQLVSVQFVISYKSKAHLSKHSLPMSTTGLTCRLVTSSSGNETEADSTIEPVPFIPFNILIE